MNYLYYDGMMYKDKPLTGMEKITVLYRSSLWTTDSPDWTRPDEEAIRSRLAQAAPDQPVCLNVEHWNHLTEIDKYIELIRIARNARPDLKIGIYKLPPMRDYWSAVNKINRPGYIRWIEINQWLEIIGDETDIIFPSLYTFYNNQSQWVRYARENIHQARRYGKPVIPFICPQYHSQNTDLADQWLTPYFWKLQLELCRRYADSVVIWGKRNFPFNNDTGWWTTTLAYTQGVTP